VQDMVFVETQTFVMQFALVGRWFLVADRGAIIHEFKVCVLVAAGLVDDWTFDRGGFGL